MNHSDPPYLPRPAKNVLKSVLLLCRVVHLQIFPVNYAYKYFYPPCGGAGAPTAPRLRLWVSSRVY